ncbi:TPA: hypothetical protein DDW35_02640 [Candidatus Sumerlaeota bacterium]|nr:hypothetical protein [Candidatus Sumerlaeota bacterium]
MGYAPDFAGCIYRMFLEEMAACHLVGEYVSTAHELPHLFQWYAQNLLPHLPVDWGYTLQSLNLEQRPILEIGYETYAVLFQDQVDEIIQRDLGFSGLNQEVKIATCF